MNVRMKISAFVGNASRKPGDVIDLNDTHAKRLITLGHAVPVADVVPQRPTGPRGTENAAAPASVRAAK